jgi:hypothetical protein
LPHCSTVFLLKPCAHHESERQRLTGGRSFIFNAMGIVGFVPRAILLAAVLRPEPKVMTRA